METCRDIEPFVTPVVDGEADPEQRRAVAGHLEACAACRFDTEAQRAARSVLQARASALTLTAPPALRARCEAAAAEQARTGRRALAFPRRAGWPLALAATLVVAVAGALAYGVVRPVDAAAAQLAMDHVKCFALFDQPTPLRAREVQAVLRVRHGWDVSLPGEEHAGGMTLVGGRRCLYLDGLVAHILYKQGREPVSLFVLPPDTRVREEQVEILGYSAVAFRRSGRTYVVLAHRPKAEVLAMAQIFK